MYFLKQLVGTLALPLTVAFALALIGAACRWRGLRRTALSLFALGVAIAYGGSLSPIANALLAPLEAEYPPLADDRSLASVGAIVVLGSTYTPTGDIPVTGALDGDGLARIVEGVRLALRMKEVRLVASGGAVPGQVAPAIGYARLAEELGIPASSIVVLPDSLDTGDEARNVAKLLGPAPFVLVTSAYHMPRAMRLMQRAGTHPIPAPTGQRIRPSRYLPQSLLPSSEALHRTERALHEYLGLVALALGFD